MKAANSVDVWCNSTFHITSLYYYSNALLSLIEYKIAIIITSLTNTQIFTYTWARTIVSGDTTSLLLPTLPTADPYCTSSHPCWSVVSSRALGRPVAWRDYFSLDGMSIDEDLTIHHITHCGSHISSIFVADESMSDVGIWCLFTHDQRHRTRHIGDHSIRDKGIMQLLRTVSICDTVWVSNCWYYLLLVSSRRYTVIHHVMRHHHRYHNHRTVIITIIIYYH